MPRNQDQADIFDITSYGDLHTLRIEKDYLFREFFENRREAGYKVPAKFRPDVRTEYETDIWVAEKKAQELDAKWNSKRPEYPRDYNYCGLWVGRSFTREQV